MNELYDSEFEQTQNTSTKNTNKYTLNFKVYKPVKKNGHYHCRVLTGSKHHIKLRIPFGIITNVIPLTKGQYSLNVRVQDLDFAVETIKNMESECIDIIIKENANWFSNSLTPEKIIDLFESSIYQDSISIYTTDTKSSGVFKGSIISVLEYLENTKTNIPNEASFTLICDGIYIYPTKFYLKWLIREIRELEPVEEIVPDIGELICYWKDLSIQHTQTLLELKDNHLKNIELLDKKINEINNIISRLEITTNLPEVEPLVNKLKGFLE